MVPPPEVIYPEVGIKPLKPRLVVCWTLPHDRVKFRPGFYSPAV